MPRLNAVAMRTRTHKLARDRLRELDEAVVAAKAKAREVERQAQQAQREADRLREEVVEAFAAGRDEDADKLHAEQVKADVEAAGPWQERVDGARRAAQRAEADRVAFATENWDQLIQELAPDAHAAAKAIENTLGQLVAERATWGQFEAEVATLTRLAGRTGTRVARFPAEVDELVRDARRAGGLEVPAPLPVDKAA